MPIWVQSGLIVAALVYAGAGALAWVYSERLIFQPQPPGPAASRGVTRIPTADGDSVAVRWLPNPAARFTLLYSHGNAEDLGDLAPFLEDLRAAGFQVLAYDYRGYGASTRRAPTERRAYHDAEAAYAHLTGALGVSPERVILHGRSLGGGIASHLAVEHPAAGLVLESTFTSAFRVPIPRPIFPFDRFATASRLRRVPVPVLVIHGTRDEVIPFAHGERLRAAARTPVRHLWVEGAGHNDLALVAGERYGRALREFAASLGGAAPAAP
jgi:hypothetical protein